MSLEIAVGLAYLSNRTLVFPGDSPLEHSGKPVWNLRITDLFDMPVSVASLQEATAACVGKATAYCSWDHQPFTHLVFCMPDQVDNPDDDMLEFMYYRGLLVTLPPGSDMDTAAMLHMSGTRHFCQYSTFFYLPDERRGPLYEVINAIKPKQEYKRLADDIAASIGPFNADTCSSAISNYIYGRVLISCIFMCFH